MIFISISLFLIAGYFSMMHQQYRNFKHFATPGDPVRFYINEESFRGIIYFIDDDRMMIDFNDEIISVPLNDTYPVITHKYTMKCQA